MKKLFILAAAVVATVACSKSEVNEINPLDPNVIVFSPYAGAITKAQAATAVNMGSKGIGIYAYEGTIADNPMFIPNDKATSTDGTTWSTMLAHFWPVVPTTINFYAYYPYLANATKDADGVITNYPQLVTSAANQVDVMVSALKSQKEDKVCFNMKHALSAIDFRISVEDEAGVEVVINSFAIAGVKSKHSGLNLVSGLFVMPSTDETLSKDALYTYGTTADFLKPIIVDANTPSVDLSQTIGLSSNVNKDGEFMLLPQTLISWDPSDETSAAVAGARVLINYTLKRNGTELLSNVNAAFPLPNTNSWVNGKKYLYTLTFMNDSNGGHDPVTGEELLQGKEIVFGVCTIDAWDCSPDDVEVADI